MLKTIDALPASTLELYHRAIAAREHAYVPYSHCRVGAAVRLSGGAVFTGCNVENSSFGATICAERAAIVAAVTEVGRAVISEVMIVTDAETPWPPCGLCRQVIAEFVQSCTIYAANLEGKVSVFSLESLYPHPFGPEQMHR